MSTYFFNRIKTTRVNGKTFEHPVTIEVDAESRELAESSLQGMYTVSYTHLRAHETN